MNLIKGILFFNIILICNGFIFPQNYLNYLKINSFQNRKENFNQTIIPKLLFLEKNSFEQEETFDHFVEKPNYNFSHLGGYKNIKNELLQMKDILNNIEKYKEFNIRVPKGLLLEGPPGNGKTLLAKCFAGECNFKFICISGSEFNEKYIGVGASRIRELFKRGKENQPCIIFIDELDAVGCKRSFDNEGSSNERFQTLNQLLVSLDGFQKDSLEKIFVIGATNRKDILDEALIRSGRFDKIIHVPHPDHETRKEIIHIHLQKKPISLPIEEISDITKGMSGSDIENILNEASLHALRLNTTIHNSFVLEEIRDRILFGLSNQKHNLSLDLQKRIAIHETGHLLVSFMNPLHEKPIKITIDSNSTNSLGYTFYSILENTTGLYSKQYLKERIMTLLGGRIAEEIYFQGEISTGAVDDLSKVMELTKKMVIEHCMISHPLYSLYSEHNKQIIDKEIQNIIEYSYHKVFIFLQNNIQLLIWFSNQLLHHKTLSKDSLSSTLKKGLELYPSKDIHIES
jgi:cell division protease FtsH